MEDIRCNFCGYIPSMKIVERDPRHRNRPLKIEHDEREWLRELRKFLPEIFDFVDDYELRNAYRNFSDDFFCAGWMTPSKETAEEFTNSILILKEDGSVVDPSKK